MNYTINASGRRLGRVATEAADMLRGKTRTDFTRNEAPSLQVTIENAGKLFIGEKKRAQKTYERYSGYPSGRKVETLDRLTARRGIGVAMRRAVYGMLPKNKLRARIIKNLIIKE